MAVSIQTKLREHVFSLLDNTRRTHLIDLEHCPPILNEDTQIPRSILGAKKGVTETLPSRKMLSERHV